jgi:hypothetical protein
MLILRAMMRKKTSGTPKRRKRMGKRKMERV